MARTTMADLLARIAALEAERDAKPAAAASETLSWPARMAIARAASKGGHCAKHHVIKGVDTGERSFATVTGFAQHRTWCKG